MRWGRGPRWGLGTLPARQCQFTPDKNMYIREAVFLDAERLKTILEERLGMAPELFEGDDDPKGILKTATLTIAWKRRETDDNDA